MNAEVLAEGNSMYDLIWSDECRQTVDIRILGGLPVTVEYEVNKNNRVSSWQIDAVCGRVVKSVPHWLHKRINESQSETEILDACEKHWRENFADN